MATGAGILSLLGTLKNGVLDLLYPQLCPGCDRSLSGNLSDQYLCLACTAELPFTNLHELVENPVTDKFAGRLRLRFGASMLYYRSGSLTQRMIVGFKYQKRSDIAVGLGRLYGQELREVDVLKDLAGIIPVPLHPSRFRQRGYNQAEKIATGLAESMNVAVLKKALKRNTFEVSQTKKGKEERFTNVEETFSAGATDLNDQHVLLVDDVLTTGATLEACAEALLAKYPRVIISIATLAVRE
ncbi:phosphoribosyltransferase [Lewinellaceae bacterium SD302]|nr:phosphoribosyltransferase [Lewinellaceae bacterium SD302]